ncbi:sulfotransferase 1E1-like [Coccinella septempunctata]|uniref:sulfotransferase 1E1-like n=1 Tax=Coccinella septempunctata TaxID=41139 RepID=UPI001D072A63|nr:sulfotransferase 1E1-like [Coccinella septempunctata]
MEIVDVEKNLNEELISYFRGMKDGFVQVGDKKWFYPKKYRQLAEAFKGFEVRSDDIWITGYPRSGTTLTEEIAWLLSHDLDFEETRRVGVHKRVRFFEGSLVINEKSMQEILSKFPGEVSAFQSMLNTLDELKNRKDRRVIKTHLPFELLPKDLLTKGCKVIYICRNPKDVSVSHFHLQSSARHIKFCGNFPKYWEYFRNGNCMFGPYFEHVRQGYEKIGSKNFMFAFYEDFKKDRRAYISDLSHFLEFPISEEQLDKLEEYMDIENFRKVARVPMKDENNQTISFIRNGKVGGWRDHFTEEMINDADEWIQMNIEKIGIRYPQQEG